MINKDFFAALDDLEREKGIDKSVFVAALENALSFACKKNFGEAMNVELKLNPEKGGIEVCAYKNIVETVEDPEDFGILRADGEDGGTANASKDEAEERNGKTETDVEMNNLKNGPEEENEKFEEGTRKTDSKTEATGENHDSKVEAKR